MSLVLTNCKIWHHVFDLSSFSNRVALDYQSRPLIDSRFGHGTEINKGGVKTVAATYGGFGEEDVNASVPTMFSEMGLPNRPITVAAVGAAAGDAAYGFLGQVGDVRFFGQHGELNPFSGGARSTGTPLVRGVMLSPKITVGAGIAFSTGINLGPVAANQTIFGGLHIFATAGTPSIAVDINSDDNSGFTSPVARLTFTPWSARQSEWKSAAGPFTDSWWRVGYNVSGTTPSATFGVFFGIATTL